MMMLLFLFDKSPLAGGARVVYTLHVACMFIPGCCVLLLTV